MFRVEAVLGPSIKPFQVREVERLVDLLDAVSPDFNVAFIEVPEASVEGSLEILSRPTILQTVASRATGSLLATMQPNSVGVPE